MSLRRAVILINAEMEFLVGRLLGGKMPPPALGFALSPAQGNSTPAPSSSYSVQDLVRDMGIVFGVPKYRTSKPKKVTRKSSYTRLLSPAENLITCPACSNIHPAETICDKCYEKVRLLTNEIKTKMMQYNPYVGEAQDKELFVKFSEEKPDPAVVNGKRVVEIEKTRPSWFKQLLVHKK